MGFIIKKTAATDIVKAKVTLTSANLLTPGYIYNIPEYPAIPDYFWNVSYMIGFIRIVNSPPTVYVGTSQIHIQTNSAATLQFRFQPTVMQFSGINFNAIQSTGILGTHYASNRGLQIHNPGILTLGDTELDIYIGATLIKQ
jgi:hypothetical protein